MVRDSPHWGFVPHLAQVCVGEGTGQWEGCDITRPCLPAFLQHKHSSGQLPGTGGLTESGATQPSTSSGHVNLPRQTRRLSVQSCLRTVRNHLLPGGPAGMAQGLWAQLGTAGQQVSHVGLKCTPSHPRWPRDVLRLGAAVGLCSPPSPFPVSLPSFLCFLFYFLLFKV